MLKVDFPSSDHEDLVPLWLWSEQKGVFSHETALALHQLSDLLPSKRHLTVPASWTHRRLCPPKDVELHPADLASKEKMWLGSIPVTTPVGAVYDCATAHVAPEFIEQVVEQGVRRHLFRRSDVRAIRSQT